MRSWKNLQNSKKPSIPNSFHLHVEQQKPLISQGFFTQLPAGLEPETYALRKFIFSFWHFHDMRKSEVLSHFPRFSLYYSAMFFALFIHRSRQIVDKVLYWYIVPICLHATLPSPRSICCASTPPVALHLPEDSTSLRSHQPDPPVLCLGSSGASPS
mgnify:CR=1 FL=1